MNPTAELPIRVGTSRPLRTLVVPVGLAAHAAGTSDAAALQCAALLARMSGARVVLVHVFGVPKDWYYWEASATEALTRAAQEQAEGRLVKAAQTLYYEGVPVEVAVVRRVDVGEGIVSAVEDVGADLLVMGTRGLAASKGGGSVTVHVARRTPCALLAVYRRAPSAVRPVVRPLPERLRRLLLVTSLEGVAAEGGRLAVALAAYHNAHLDVIVAPPPLAHAGSGIEGVLARLANQLEAPVPSKEEANDQLVNANVFEAAEANEVARIAEGRRPDLVVLAGATTCPFDALAYGLADTTASVLIHAPQN